MSDTALGPVSLGLSAAIAWGAADFTGGIASKRASVYGVVVGSELAGLMLLFPIAILSGEPTPPLQVWLVSGLAGLAGGFGLTLFYRALSGGQMSIAAPVSALVGAVIPILAGSLLQGLPKQTALAGILLAWFAILLISRGEDGREIKALNLKALALPLGAGVFFGLFFVLLHQASQEALLWPVIATRIASISFLILIARATRPSWRVEHAYWPLVITCGLLDTGGNVFYVVAGQLGRLDIAAVLSSLYPATTVAMAWLILKERISLTQILGVALALIAIMLIVV
jgi:drug/metabolite transporter (DMT)-like permease